ncbi:hypothetical protein HDF16_003809 [Granulicella aggregans]|uniref:DUF4177 domain-containing protein n=1 Tax=Granulicella aggregans TaxID=474949 RepID=A0A7W8E501_9BACT|nr:hypothetical protein [Granulicella aggregans]MBB5059086.1 hypothetical protein [Granulicella aggregans]
MKKWQYAHVAYNRHRKSGEVCLSFDHVKAMSEIDPSKGLYVDMFLEAAGQAGWELATVMLPFPKGKELATGGDDEDNNSFVVVQDPLDIQWLIFKREL